MVLPNVLTSKASLENLNYSTKQVLIKHEPLNRRKRPKRPKRRTVKKINRMAKCERDMRNPQLMYTASSEKENIKREQDYQIR